MAATTVKVATFDGPGARPRIQTVERPRVPERAALIEVGACGVCGTDLHILKGHWPKPLPWPFTLGHEVAGVIAEKGPGLEADYMGKPLEVGAKVMIPPLMPCGECDYCRHYPAHANKCLNPTYYGRYIPFAKPPHLWGGWAEMVYVDLDMFPATKIYRLPDDMTCMQGSLSEPLACCIRALGRARSTGGFQYGDTVVVQGAGPIAVLMVASAREMGAGTIAVIGAPEEPRLALCREFSAAGTVCLDDHPTSAARIDAVRDLLAGFGARFGADLVIDCAGHPSAGPEGLEMLRDGGTYVEMGQFTDAGAIATNWHRICAKDVTIVASWGITAGDLPLGVDMLHRARERFPWSRLQTVFPFTEEGVQEATRKAMAMECVKATILPNPSLGE